MVIGFTTTYAISAYHHWCWEFESWSGWGVQHNVTKFINDLWQVGGFHQFLQFPPPMKLTATRYNWNIVESGIEHHQTNISVGRIKCVPPPSIKPSLNLVSYQWQLYQFVCLKCWKSVWTPFRPNLWLTKVMSTVISTKTQLWLGKQGNTWPEMKLHYKVPLLGLSHKNFKIWYA